MLSKDENIALANILFPNVIDTIESLRKEFPSRSEKVVTRIAPSPTGFLHMGALFMSFIDERIAIQNNGIFYLRIEDTDAKRETETGVSDIISGLKRFGVHLNEGAIGEDGEEVGMYGPYTQSKRSRFYHAFAKELVAKGLAYPCFLNETETEEIRTLQTATGKFPGIYGSYSPWRIQTYETVVERLQKNNPYVLRFRAPELAGRISVVDEIRGKLEMDENHLDIVLLKKDGIPTYHFAHVVDDYLMGTTHVLRSEEWLPSLPLHVQLFAACGLEAPKYAHTAQLMKIDNGNRRKLSKRKDVEADVMFFFKAGYPVEAIKNYLAGIIDSGYEEWLAANPDKTYRDFTFSFEKMSRSGALFDIKKLDSVSNALLSSISNDELFSTILTWAKEFNEELFTLLEENADIAKRAISIQRLTDRDPKKFTKYSDIESYIVMFIPELFEKQKEGRGSIELPVDSVVVKQVLTSVANSYDENLDAEAWINFMRNLAWELGFARDNAEWKAGWRIGKFGDFAMIVRVGLAASTTAPDLYETMKVLGKEESCKRLLDFASEL